MLGLICENNKILIGISLFISESQQLNLQKHQHLSNIFSKAQKLYSLRIVLLYSMIYFQ